MSNLKNKPAAPSATTEEPKPKPKLNKRRLAILLAWVAAATALVLLSIFVSPWMILLVPLGLVSGLMFLGLLCAACVGIWKWLHDISDSDIDKETY